MKQNLINVINKLRIHDNDEREVKGQKAAILGLLSNLIISLLKIIVALFSQSISVFIDAFNNVLDALSSMISYIGFKVSNKPADYHHPFGHGRFEMVSEIFVSIVIIGVGMSFSYSSILNIINPSKITIDTMSLLLLFFSIAMKIWQASFNLKLGKQINSSLLHSTAQDSLNDVYINVIIVVGLIVQTYFNVIVDGVLGLLLSLFIIYSGIKMLIGASKQILGVRISDTEILKMQDILEKQEYILGYHDLIVHQYGQVQYASVHVEIDASLSLLKAHEISDRIEYLFKKHLAVELVVHLDPVDLNDRRLIEINEHINSTINKNQLSLSFHDLRIIKHPLQDILAFDLVCLDDQLSDEEIMSILKKQLKESYVYEIQITLDRNVLEVVEQQ
ncbi:MAG: cation transporter [Erysipelothrix sp.]|nr:cation transporter [Erysipelothrix sp.]